MKLDQPALCGMNRRGLWATALFVASLLPTLNGCASDDSADSSPFNDRQQKAIEDPFNYSAFDKSKDPYNVSKESPQGIKRDLDHVFNP